MTNVFLHKNTFTICQHDSMNDFDTSVPMQQKIINANVLANQMNHKMKK